MLEPFTTAADSFLRFENYRLLAIFVGLRRHKVGSDFACMSRIVRGPNPAWVLCKGARVGPFGRIEFPPCPGSASKHAQTAFSRNACTCQNNDFAHTASSGCPDCSFSSAYVSYGRAASGCAAGQLFKSHRAMKFSNAKRHIASVSHIMGSGYAASAHRAIGMANDLVLVCLLGGMGSSYIPIRLFQGSPFF
jgi:hypothetical protein